MGKTGYLSKPPPDIEQAITALAESVYRDLSAAEDALYRDEEWGPRFYEVSTACGMAHLALQREDVAEALLRLTIALQEVRALLIGEVGDDDSDDDL